MNGGFVAKENNSGSRVKPQRLFSRVTKKPILGTPRASNPNTKTQKTKPPVFGNIAPFKKNSAPLPMQGTTAAVKQQKIAAPRVAPRGNAAARSTFMGGPAIK